MAMDTVGAGERRDDDAPDDLDDDGAVHRVIARELGPQMADAFSQARATQERWARRRHPDDGLRERKKRRTRQQISDVATALFVARGFDNVRVSEIAEIVGVSEKTIYNYFPTKEALVFDHADEGIARVAAALRERRQGESPVKAMLRALSEDLSELADIPDAVNGFLPAFADMVNSTPALRAAWLEFQDRLVKIADEELAALADVDPRDPEPMIAARAIVGLQELSFTSRMRRIEEGLRGSALHDAVMADLERAARVLDAGLWSFNVLTQNARTRAQLREAAQAAEEARRQMVEALKQARKAWRDLRGRERPDRADARLWERMDRADAHVRERMERAARLRERADRADARVRERHGR